MRLVMAFCLVFRLSNSHKLLLGVGKRSELRLSVRYVLKWKGFNTLSALGSEMVFFELR